MGTQKEWDRSLRESGEEDGFNSLGYDTGKRRDGQRQMGRKCEEAHKSPRLYQTGKAPIRY